VLRSVTSSWVFNLQASQHFHCFRIYRETLSRFSCATSPCDRSIAGSVGIEVMSLWEEMSRVLCERVARYAGHSGNRGGPHRLGAQFG
ncbi:hypothetical protein ABLN72_10530, partial [Mycobacterium tuberculosis]